MSSDSPSLSDVLYPQIEPHTTGNLPVSDLHTIAWERTGNVNGEPVIVIHGGPGGGVNHHIDNILTLKSSILFNSIKEDVENQFLMQS